MGISREEIIKYALDLGFSDVRFADANDLVNAPSLSAPCSCAGHFSPTCVIVLFSDYLPAQTAPKGSISLSPYYIASNFSYHAGKKIAEYIEQHGANAALCQHLWAKKIAVKTGGFIGDNGFYYHERFGSYVCIETILTDAAEPVDYTQNIKDNEKKCLHCGRCTAACPSGAVGNIENCLKTHLYHKIPEHLRPCIYQLFGCEICQNACPQNSQSRTQAHTYTLEGLINGEYKKELKKIAGGNLVRANRLVSQAVIYAANQKEYNLADQIKEIAESSQEPVRTHALWAYEKLCEKNREAADK